LRVARSFLIYNSFEEKKMNLNLKKALLAGTAIVAVGAFAMSSASAAEVTTAGATNWDGVAADFAGSDADSLTFGGAHVATVAPGEDIGTTTTNSLEMSIDTRTSTGEVIFDGGAASPAVSTVYGAIGDSSNFGAGNAATLTIGDDGNNDGGNVSLFGNVATGTVINIQTGTGNGTLTLGDGTTATTVGANIDLDTGAAGNGNTVLNLNGTTVTGTLTNTDTDNGAGGIVINVDENSSLDGNVDLTTVAGSVIVDDGKTLSIGATTFDVLATGTVVLGNATTDGATLVFDGTGVQAVTGLIDSDVVNKGAISVTNTGGVVTFNQNIGTTLDLATFTMADSSSVNTVGELRANTVTVGTGATLNADDDIVGNVANSGTLDIAGGAAAITGNVTGTGTLLVDTSSTILGNVTQGATTIGAGDVLTIDAVAVDAGVVSLGTTTLTDGTSGLTIISNAGATGVQTVSGTITGDDNDGVITLGNDTNEIQNYVVNATIGTDAADVEDLIIGGNTNAAVITATLNANAFVDDVDVGNGDVLNLHGTTYEFDTVDSVGGNDASTLNVGSGTSATTLTVNGAIGGAQEVGILNVRTGSTMNITNNLSVNSATNGAINIDGTLVVDSAGGVTVGNATTGNIQLDGTLTVNGAVGTLALGNGSTLIEVGYAGTGATINVGNVIATADNVTFGDSAGDTAALVYNETAAFDPDATTGIDATGDTITFTADTVTTVRLGDAVTAWEDGDVITFIDNGAGTDITTALGDGRIVLGDGGLLTLTNTGSDANTLTATVGYANAANVFTAGSTGAGAANALLALEDDGDANLDTLRNRLVAAATPAAQQAIAESVAPTADGGFVVAGNQAAGLTLDATNARIELARAGSSDTGMVAGQMGEGVGIWGKAFGQMADQDQREGVAGYDADTFGVAVGIDSENVVPGMLVGASFSYADTEVESENVNSTDTEVDSYQFSLYGSKDLANNTYVTGIASYARNNIDQTRNNVGGTAGNVAKGDFDSDQFGVYAELGRDYMMNGGMTLTPRVLANYQHVSFDGYTETGSTANLRVENDDMNIFELGLGATASWDLQDTMGNMIRPSLSAEYRFDTIGDEVEATSSFTGGGASFKTEGFDPAQSSFTVGAGVEYDVADQWTLSGDYDYTFKEDYDAHSLSVRAGYKF
jgi:outer membrane autotransporter protein